jgi:hypothetical protein
METAANGFGTGLPVTSSATAQVVNSVPLYWLRNRYGDIYPSQGTAFYGSPHGSGFRAATVTGAAATLDGLGYWVVNRAGKVFNFGDAAALPAVRHSHRINGIVAAPGGGYWLYSPAGDIYPSQGAKSYGSPATSGVHGSRITGVTATPDGKGYWVVDAVGDVFPYGDAARLSAIGHRHAITGIFR